MSPTTKPHRELRVQVPRHDSQRIGPVMIKNVLRVASEDSVRVDVGQTALDHSSALAQAIDSASQWNSLLLSARAERGPQFDVATQEFLVEEDSDLYYDPSPLRVDEQLNNFDKSSSSSPSHRQPQEHSPSLVRTGSMPSRGMTPSMSGQAQLYNTLQAMVSSRHPYQNAHQSMPPYGMPGMPQGQFYGGGNDVVMGNPAMGGGIPDVSMSPEVRRRVTRGMSMDEFGSMH